MLGRWKRSTVAAAAAVGWMALIFALSALPADAIPTGFTGLSSLGHFLLYAILGALYVAALESHLPPGGATALAIGLASAYGVTDEVHQMFVSGRNPDPVDWLVDTAGAALAALLLLWLRRHRSGTIDADER